MQRNTILFLMIFVSLGCDKYILPSEKNKLLGKWEQIEGNTFPLLLYGFDYQVTCHCESSNGASMDIVFDSRAEVTRTIDWEFLKNGSLIQTDHISVAVPVCPPGELSCMSGRRLEYESTETVTTQWAQWEFTPKEDELNIAYDNGLSVQFQVVELDFKELYVTGATDTAEVEIQFEKK